LEFPHNNAIILQRPVMSWTAGECAWHCTRTRANQYVLYALRWSHTRKTLSGSQSQMASIRLQLAVSCSPLSRRVFTLQEVIEITLNVSNIAKTRIEFSQRTCFPLIANHWFSGFDYRLEWQSHPCENARTLILTMFRRNSVSLNIIWF